MREKVNTLVLVTLLLVLTNFFEPEIGVTHQNWTLAYSVASSKIPAWFVRGTSISALRIACNYVRNVFYIIRKRTSYLRKFHIELCFPFPTLYRVMLPIYDFIFIESYASHLRLYLGLYVPFTTLYGVMLPIYDFIFI
jgi:hypothetical protein